MPVVSALLLELESSVAIFLVEGRSVFLRVCHPWVVWLKPKIPHTTMRGPEFREGFFLSGGCVVPSWKVESKSVVVTFL